MNPGSLDGAHNLQEHRQLAECSTRVQSRHLRQTMPRVPKRRMLLKGARGTFPGRRGSRQAKQGRNPSYSIA